MVIWITGLSASGKTTLTRAIRDLLARRLANVVILDGTEIRTALGNDLGHGEADRRVQIRRLQGLAKVLSDQGLIVLVAALYSHQDLLAWNRKNFSKYFEIYLKASVDFLRRRDPNNLYHRALAGRLRDVVGVDIPWHEPLHPDLVIEAEKAPDPTRLAHETTSRIPFLREPVDSA